MISNMTRDAFRQAIIAQDDDSDYSESGWLALVHDGQAAIASYSHCSCYGTFESLCGGGVSDYFKEGSPEFNWQGTIADMVRMAAKRADPNFPDRDANPEDHDYDHLVAMYDQVMEWDRKRIADAVRNDTP